MVFTAPSISARMAVSRASVMFVCLIIIFEIPPCVFARMRSLFFKYPDALKSIRLFGQKQARVCKGGRP